MNKRKPPVEIAGYVERFVWVVDIYDRTFRQKWMSVFNENYSEDEVTPWLGNSGVDDCPF